MERGKVQEEGVGRGSSDVEEGEVPGVRAEGGKFRGGESKGWEVLGMEWKGGRCRVREW